MIKTYLAVPYADRLEAKALGAWWDAKARLWYCDQADESKFSKWSPVRIERPKARPAVMSKPGVSTPRTDFSMPDCGCTNVPPWEHCGHTEPALEGEELAHIRSM